MLNILSVTLLVFRKIYNTALATVTLMFLVNDKLVWRDKTVTRAMELWCT